MAFYGFEDREHPVTTHNESYDIGALVCPCCGQSCGGLHHSFVEVFCRESEDAEHGIHATIASNTFMNFSDMPGVAEAVQKNGRPPYPLLDRHTAHDVPGSNPSLRRDGIRIGFFCEQGCRATLAIAQHKGTTYIWWEEMEHWRDATSQQKSVDLGG